VIHRIELYFGFREAAGATTNLQCSHTESIPPSPEEEEDDDVCAVASRAGPVKEPTPCSKQIGATTGRDTLPLTRLRHAEQTMISRPHSTQGGEKSAGSPPPRHIESMREAS